MRKIVGLLMIFLLMVAFAGCGAKTVKGFQVSKEVAETVLYESRVMFNQGKMDEATWNKVLKMYDNLKVAQDTAINARIAYLKTGTDADKKKLENYTGVVNELTSGLIAIASQFGFADKVLLGGAK